MANPLDRSWYNALIDDDGSGTTGTIWNKGQVNGLLNTVDTSLAGIVDKSGTPVSGQIPIFNDADSVRGDAALTFTGAGFNVGLPLNVTTGTIVVRNDNAPVDQRRWGLIAYSDGALRFVQMNDAQSVWLTTPMNLRPGDGAVVLNHGRLVFLGATPSGDSTTLDDYREGTWTPTLTATGGASGQSYDVRTATYSKIGRTVHAHYLIRLSVTGTFSGDLAIGGLPFVAQSLGQAWYIGAVHYQALLTPMTSLVMMIDADNAYAKLMKVTGNGGNTTQVGLTSADVGVSSLFAGSITYQTAY